MRHIARVKTKRSVQATLAATFLCLSLGGLTGCKSTLQEVNIGYDTSARPVFKRSTRIYIATPTDGVYKKESIIMSGKRTADALYVEFTKRSSKVSWRQTSESLDEALDSSRTANADYLIFPRIVTWEDHDTEWSGRRDRLGLRFEVYETASGKRIYATEFNSKSKGMSEGGDAPQDLLQPVMNEFVGSLYNETNTQGSF